MADSGYYSINDFPGDGSQTTFEVSFAGGYISRSHISARLFRDSDKTFSDITFTWMNSFTIKLAVPVPVGYTLRIYRKTPIDRPLVDYSDGALLSEVNLDTANKQAIFAAAEAADAFGTVPGNDALRDATAALVFARSRVNHTGTQAMSTVDGLVAALAATVSTAALAAGTVPITIKVNDVNAIARSLITKLGDAVSVKDFGAKGDGVTDDTLAFNRAVASGRCVVVPWVPVGYVVNKIKVVPNMQLVGEKAGECLGPTLICNVPNSCLFEQTSTTEKVIPHIVMSNMCWRAGDGIFGVDGFRGMDQTDYSGYVLFSGIETHRSLRWGYNSLFIYATWYNCRDGYLPGIGTFTSAHGFIKSEAVTYGQPNASNTNNVVECKIFRGYGVDASVQLDYGDSWTFTGTRWENMDTPAVRAKSVRKLLFNYPRAEGSRMPVFVVLQASPGSGVGTTCVVRDGLFALDMENFLAASCDGLSRVSFVDCEWAIVNTGAKLVDFPLAITANHNNRVSGAGAAGFMLGMGHDHREAGRWYWNGAANNNVNNMLFQFAGGVTATGGYTGRTNYAVSNAWVTVATGEVGYGAMVRLSGAVSAGPFAGAQFRYLIDFQTGDATASTTGEIRQVYSPRLPAGSTVSFRISGNDLQMMIDDPNRPLNVCSTVII